jgi:curli biogenesis system outer membrane secretion channel CsgG
MEKFMRTFLRSIVAAAATAVAVVATPDPAIAQSARASRPTVAVLDLDFGSVQQWWSGNWDIGKGVADLLVDELVNDGSFRVIERKRLDAILAEQNFSNSERADPDQASVAKIGKALGVKYLIVGSITKFGTENKNTGVNAGAFGGGKFGIGRVGTSKGKATVAVTLRMVDTSTGEIMISAKGQAESSRSGMLLGGAGGGGAGGGGEVAMGSSEFRETILGEATEKAVTMVTTSLVAKKTNLQ